MTEVIIIISLLVLVVYFATKASKEKQKTRRLQIDSRIIKRRPKIQSEPDATNENIVNDIRRGGF